MKRKEIVKYCVAFLIGILLALIIASVFSAETLPEPANVYVNF